MNDRPNLTSSPRLICLISLLALSMTWAASSPAQTNREGSYRERLSSQAQQRTQQAQQTQQGQVQQSTQRSRAGVPVTQPTFTPAAPAAPGAPGIPAAPAGTVQPGRIPRLDPSSLHLNYLNDGTVRGTAITDAIIMVCAGERDPMIRENAVIMNRVRTGQFPAVFDQYMQQYDQSYEQQLVIFGRGPCAFNAVEQAYVAYLTNLDRLVQQSAMTREALAAASVPGQTRQTPQATTGIGAQIITTAGGEQLDCMHAGNRDQSQACYQVTRQTRMSPYIQVIGAATGYAAWAEACGDPSGPAVKQDALSRIASLPAANRRAIVATGEASAQALTIVIQQMIATYPDACAQSLPQYRTGYDQAVALAESN